MLISEHLRHRDQTGAKSLLLAGRHGHQVAEVCQAAVQRGPSSSR
jgi:hypothetical protein